jgi:hypothetical protein
MQLLDSWIISGSLQLTGLASAGARLLQCDANGLVAATPAGADGQLLKLVAGAPAWSSVVPSHSHSASDVTSGNLAVARLPSGIAGCVLGDMICGFGTNQWGVFNGNMGLTPKFLRGMGNGSSAGVPTWEYPMLVYAGGSAVGAGYRLEFTNGGGITWSGVELAGIVAVTALISSVPSHSHSASDITSGNLGVARLPSGIAGCVLGDMICGFGTNQWGVFNGNMGLTPKFLRGVGNGSSAGVPTWEYPMLVYAGGSAVGAGYRLEFANTGQITWSGLELAGVVAITATIMTVPNHTHWAADLLSLPGHGHSASDIVDGRLSRLRLPAPMAGWAEQACTVSRTVVCSGFSPENLASVLSTLINDLRTYGILTYAA